jgi:hypothetical protein
LSTVYIRNCPLSSDEHPRRTVLRIASFVTDDQAVDEAANQLEAMVRSTAWQYPESLVAIIGKEVIFGAVPAVTTEAGGIAINARMSSHEPF